MVYIGIDPGSRSGAIAIISECATRGHHTVTVFPFDEKRMVDELDGLIPEKCKCVVERVWSFPKEGVSGAFKFGTNYGYILGVLTALKIPFETITPSKWKKEFQANSDKNKSVAIAQRLFPNVNLKKSQQAKKSNDGMAEALLMAEYARRKM